MGILEIITIIFICVLLASVTYLKRMLDLGGSITAFIIGIIIGIQGGIIWIFLLLIFLGSSFLATRYKFNYKKDKGFQEGKKGERGAINVLANGIVPMVLALLHIPNGSVNFLGLGIIPHKIVIFLFVTSVAGAAADTLASEMGILSNKTYLITNFKKVKPGVNGGISLLGELWAFFGSAYTFFWAFIVFHFLEGLYIEPSLLIFGTIMGFISCQIDSVFGATLERKGKIGKSTVNMMAVSITVFMVGVILWLIKF